MTNYDEQDKADFAECLSMVNDVVSYLNCPYFQFCQGLTDTPGACQIGCAAESPACVTDDSPEGLTSTAITMLGEISQILERK